jgi:hypothetical protein
MTCTIRGPCELDLPNAAPLAQAGDIEALEDMRMLDDGDSALERALGTADPIRVNAMNGRITVLFRARAPP